MKTEMRQALAREPYEQKIEKVEQLVRLAKEFPRQLTSSAAEIDDTTGAKEKVIVSAICNRNVLEFLYNGKPRIVEPQTYGISTAGHPLLRGYQRAGGSGSGQAKGLRLFETAKISRLKRTGEQFTKARPEHNPSDSAMKEVRATLPLPASA
ncbi:MAG: hypothetical protein DME99_08020 [Verrucomicrobia bacterium]|nr:MAG: hypothetical protein DME99_08020 [Verrucomicrobiota bacterium]